MASICFFAEITVSEHKFTFSSHTYKQSFIDRWIFHLTAPKIGTFVTFDDFGDYAICSIHYTNFLIGPYYEEKFSPWQI